MRLSSLLFAASVLAVVDAAAQQPRQPDIEAVERAILAATNALRAAHQQPALKLDARLERAAESFAKYMASRDEYAHDADGRTPAQRARAAGYRDCMVAENIAYQMRTRGFETAELARKFATGWENSPGHRRNMLDPEAVEIGIAVAYSEETSRYYGVQLFGRPESMRVSFEVRNESRQDLRYKVGGQDYTLQGRAERRHHVCGDIRVVFDRPSGDRSFTPAPGERFTITPGGKLHRAARD
jgi:uncharacterized protein YkwD